VQSLSSKHLHKRTRSSHNVSRWRKVLEGGICCQPIIPERCHTRTPVLEAEDVDKVEGQCVWTVVQVKQTTASPGLDALSTGGTPPGRAVLAACLCPVLDKLWEVKQLLDDALQAKVVEVLQSNRQRHNTNGW
jgi:hypothetical protein